MKFILPNPPQRDDPEFDEWWDWALSCAKILIFQDLKTEKLEKLSLFRMLKDSKERYCNEEKQGAIDLSEIIWLIRDLEYLSENKEDSYLDFRKKLVSGVNNEFHYLTGLWFEIRVSTILLNMRLHYRRPDPPDFEIEFEDDVIYIECYSPRVSSNKDIPKKVVDSIQRKRRKYKLTEHNKNFILFLDLTSLIHQSVGEYINDQNVFQEFENAFIKSFQESEFSAITCFWFGHSKVGEEDIRTYSSRFILNRNNSIVERFLKKLLQDFKKEELRILLPSLPM